MTEVSTASTSTKQHPFISSLPPELIILIFSYADLQEVFNLTQTTKSFRSICSISESIWIKPLIKSAINSNVHLFESPNSELDLNACTKLMILGKIDNLLPSSTWNYVLPYLSRNFILYSMELPRLKNSEWMEICIKRFLPSTIQIEIERRNKLLNSGDSTWRSFFLKQLYVLEHRAENACTHHEHLCQFLVLHRNKKYGLTRNRVAARNFDPLMVFEQYKIQNGLTNRETVQISIPRHLGPPDLQMYIIVTIGKENSFLKNEVTMKILSSIERWKPNQSNSILGPALITAIINPSPDLLRLNLTHSSSYISLEPLDLIKVSELFAECEMGFGSGF